MCKFLLLFFLFSAQSLFADKEYYNEMLYAYGSYGPTPHPGFPTSWRRMLLGEITDKVIVSNGGSRERLSIHFNDPDFLFEKNHDDLSYKDNFEETFVYGGGENLIAKGLVFMHATIKSYSEQDLRIKFGEVFPKISYQMTPLNILVGVDWNYVAENNFAFYPRDHRAKRFEDKVDYDYGYLNIKRELVALKGRGFSTETRAFLLDTYDLKEDLSDPKNIKIVPEEEGVILEDGLTFNINHELVDSDGYWLIPAGKTILVKWYIQSQKALSLPDRLLKKGRIPRACKESENIYFSWQSQNHLKPYYFLDTCYNYETTRPYYSPWVMEAYRASFPSYPRNPPRENLDIRTNAPPLEIAREFDRFPGEDADRRREDREAELARERAAAEWAEKFRRLYYDRKFQFLGTKEISLVIDKDLDIQVLGWRPQALLLRLEGNGTRKMGGERWPL